MLSSSAQGPSAVCAHRLGVCIPEALTYAVRFGVVVLELYGAVAQLHNVRAATRADAPVRSLVQFAPS